MLEIHGLMGLVVYGKYYYERVPSARRGERGKGCQVWMNPCPNNTTTQPDDALQCGWFPEDPSYQRRGIQPRERTTIEHLHYQYGIGQG